jgi:hypothetical protein
MVATSLHTAPPATPTFNLGTEVPTTASVLPDAPLNVPGHPLTSVVVTQCNYIVVIYLTMPDGRLIRIDPTTKMNWGDALTMAASATRSEQAAITCGEPEYNGT